MDSLILKKPLLVNGVEIKELQCNLDELTAFDMERAGKLEKKDGNFINVVELDAGYHFKIFCVAVTKYQQDITISDLERLGAKDYTEAVRGVRNFFFGSSEELSREITGGE